MSKALYEPIDLEEMESSSSHKCPLKAHKPNHHHSWRCDRIKGAKVCKSNINSYNSMGIRGWRCSACDFDLCIACLKTEKFIAMCSDNRED